MVTKDGVYVLDMAAKIDATADYICKSKWGDVEFPPPFGREAYPEVRAVGLSGWPFFGGACPRKMPHWVSRAGCKLKV